MSDTITDVILRWGQDLAKAVGLGESDDSRAQRIRGQLAQQKQKVDARKLTLGAMLEKRMRTVEESVQHGELDGAEMMLELLVADVDKKLKEDAHRNVRAIAEKEDSMVKAAIQTVPVKAQAFQKEKFGARMSRVSGMADVNWNELIGDKSNAFDVISQMKVFDQDKLGKDSKISYLTFQDSMYADEPGSREKLVLAFYDKKLGTIQDKDARKALETAVAEMKAAEPGPDKTAAVNKAFAAMGMKGVRPEVEKARNDIKARYFLGKDHEAINRGRVGHTLADTVLGFAAKAQVQLEKTGRKPKADELGVKVAALTELRKAFDHVQRELIGYTGRKPPEKPPSDLTDREKALKKQIEDAGKEAFELMKGLDIGVDDESGWETGGGIGADDGEGGRDVYKAGNKVFMGKNVNIRDDQSAASAIFEELGIPYTGGASGSTVDAVGGVVEALLGEKDDANAALKDTDPRKASAEAEICMYIMGMHTAGHHSLVEMLYAAKQYPQKFFSHLRDPITDWIAWQEACSNFMKEHEALEKSPFAVRVDGKFDEKASSAARHEAMLKKFPQNIISHDECTKIFMAYCKSVLGKV